MRFVEALAGLGCRFSRQSDVYMHDHIRIVYPSQDSLKSIDSGQCSVDVLPSSKSHNVTAIAKRERSGFLLFLGLESAISWTSYGAS